MDFRSDIGTSLLLSATITLLSAGCSSSEAYVDYADIPAPAGTIAAESSDAHPVTTSSAGNVEVTVAASDAATPGETDISTTAEQPRTDSSETQPPVTANADRPDSDPVSVNDAPSEDPRPAEPGPTNSDVRQTGDVRQTPGELQDTEPREIKLLVPEKRFRPEGDSNSLRLTYDDIDLLRVLNMQPVPVDAVDYFPQWLKDLDGQRIRLRGFMFPTFVATGLTRFALARDNGICCFVKQPKIYDMIDVSMAEGQITDYIDNKPFDVEGILRIDPDGDDTELFQLYRIEDAVVLK